jgi:ribosome-associated translation inhibitor RaiA
MYEREFIGFVPDDFFDFYLVAMLRRLAEVAPYDSNCHARIERKSGGYLVQLDIRTMRGSFNGESLASDPKLAYDLAVEKLFRQLALWKKSRWAEEAA